EGHTVNARQRKQLLERGSSEARFEPGKRAGGDSCHCSQVREGESAKEPESFESWPDGVESVWQIRGHAVMLPFGNVACTSAIRFGTIDKRAKA
ncbi:MAG: hypothetical protein QOE21_1604, partial [Microbacteriaceae bacterium]|nr:hypothetical protein [Microbacteriaceae bacterium]